MLLKNQVQWKQKMSIACSRFSSDNTNYFSDNIEQIAY